MCTLFVTPSETGTGEAMTASYVARDLLRHGHAVHFAASRTTAPLLSDIFVDRVTLFAGSTAENQGLWREVVRTVRPDAIVFADYPLLFMTSGSVHLASPQWADDLRAAATHLVTFDHVGFAQGPGMVFFGPPHLTMHAENFLPVPQEMEVLLPCPLFEGRVPGFRGTPVRYWNLPLTLPTATRKQTRDRYLADGEEFLLVHSTPRWAIRMAGEMGLPHYEMLPRLMNHYLSDLQARVVMVSVNDGSLLPEERSSHLRIVNVAPVSADELERLLLSADLVLSDNTVSASLAKAVCAGVPTLALTNSLRLQQAAAVDDRMVADTVNEMERRKSGCIFPFEVFPIWSRRELQQLGVLEQPLYKEALVNVELYGGRQTAQLLEALLTDHLAKQRLHDAQHAYIAALSSVATVPDLWFAA